MRGPVRSAKLRSEYHFSRVTPEEFRLFNPISLDLSEGNLGIEDWESKQLLSILRHHKTAVQRHRPQILSIIRREETETADTADTPAKFRRYVLGVIKRAAQSQSERGDMTDISLRS